MPKALLFIRIVETFFLFFLVINYEFFDGNRQLSGGFLELAFNISINSTGEPIVLSTLMAGYFVSVLGTWLYRAKDNTQLWKWSFALASLGFLSYLNEIGRFVFGYDFQLIINMTVAVLIIDWILFVQFKRQFGNDNIHQNDSEESQIS